MKPEDQNPDSGAAAMNPAHPPGIRQPWWRGGPLTLDRREIQIPGLGFRLKILHLSDLHFSSGDDLAIEELGAVISATGGEANLVTLAGDFINDDEGLPFVEKLIALLPAGIPKFAVLGNHDTHKISLLHGIVSLLSNSRIMLPVKTVDTSRLRRILCENKVSLLEHAACESLVKGGRILVTGLRHPWVRTDHVLPESLVPPPQTESGPGLRILLVHRPDVPPEIASHFDLVLGGHTHGGQIRLPLIGPLRTNCRVPNRFASGRFRLGKAQWFVNNGCSGTRFMKPRLFVPRQISLLSIVPGTPPPLEELRLCPRVKGWLRYVE